MQTYCWIATLYYNDYINGFIIHSIDVLLMMTNFSLSWDMRTWSISPDQLLCSFVALAISLIQGKPCRKQHNSDACEIHSILTPLFFFLHQEDMNSQFLFGVERERAPRRYVRLHSDSVAHMLNLWVLGVYRYWWLPPQFDHMSRRRRRVW